MSYLLHLIVYLQIYVLVAFSLNLLLGYGGLLQVAHAAYYGLGAYAYSLCRLALGLDFIPSLAAAAIVPGILSLLISWPALRLRGDAFVMMSLAVQVAVVAVLYNWVELTGGPFGLAGIPRAATSGSMFATRGGIVVLYGVIVLGSIGILTLLKRSSFGLSLQAIRDDELAARSLGLPVRRLKVQTFAISSAFVGIAGALYAAYATYIDPTSFSLDESILMLSMVIVGGTGNVIGPLVGASVLVALPEILRFLDFSDAVAGPLRLMVYGLLLVVLMLVRPQGLAGRYRFE